MKWFFRWLRNGINNVDMDDRENETVKYTASSDRALKIGLALPKARRNIPAIASNQISLNGEVNLNQQPMHFKIYPATGGHIVEYTYYNERKDAHDQALHLIPSDLDLGTELAKIMTLEAFKR